MSESEKTEVTLETFTFKQLLPWIGKFVGLLGGGSLSFGALSFGIGYLAIKSHDAMLGLPTTTSTYESYVRTGSLFFSNSLYYLITTVSGFVWTIVFPAMLLVLVIAFILSRWSLSSLSKHLWIGFIAAYVLINLLAFLSADRLAAVLHPENKALLLKHPDEASQTGYEREIHDLLRDEKGVPKLQSRYSFHLGQTIALTCIAILLSIWRRRLGNIPSGRLKSGNGNNGFLHASDLIFRPILYALIVFHLVLLPSNYGVLCVSNEYPVVFVKLNKSSVALTEPLKDYGYLLSDMSVDLEEVVWLQREGENTLYNLFIFEKNNINKIEVVSRPGQRNILAENEEEQDVTSKR